MQGHLVLPLPAERQAGQAQQPQQHSTAAQSRTAVSPSCKSTLHTHARPYKLRSHCTLHSSCLQNGRTKLAVTSQSDCTVMSAQQYRAVQPRARTTCPHQQVDLVTGAAPRFEGAQHVFQLTETQHTDTLVSAHWFLACQNCCRGLHSAGCWHACCTPFGYCLAQTLRKCLDASHDNRVGWSQTATSDAHKRRWLARILTSWRRPSVSALTACFVAE